MSDAKLREFLQFSDADLSDNQNGQLSAGQKERLTARRSADARRWMIVIGLLLVIPVAGIIWMIKATASAGLPLTGIFQIVPAPALLIGGFVVLYVLWAVGSSLLQRPDDTLRSMQGEASYARVERLEKDYARSDSQHDEHKVVQVIELHVGGKTLADVDEGMLAIVKQGDAYKFYYTRAGGILSAEPLKKGH